MQAEKLDKEHLWSSSRIKYTVLAEVGTDLLERDWAIQSSSHWNRNESCGKWLWTLLRDSFFPFRNPFTATNPMLSGYPAKQKALGSLAGSDILVQYSALAKRAAVT